MKTIQLLLLTLLLSSCGVPEDDENKFLVELEGQTFTQVRFRATSGNWRFHNGLRNHLIKGGRITSFFNLYQEFPTIYCFGEYSGDYVSLTKKEFSDLISTPVEEEGDDGYNVHDPWGPGESEESTDPDQVALIQEFYLVLRVDKNTVTPGCSFFVEPEIYLYLRLHQNGDLFMRDYNREMEFLFRP